MATAGVVARKAFLAFAATSSGTAAEIGEVRNFRMQIEHEPAVATSFDSSGWQEVLEGTRKATVSFDAVYARAEAEQLALRKTVGSTGITSRHWTVRPSTAQNQLWRFQGFVTSLELTAEENAVVAHNFTITNTRAVTFTS